LFYKTRWRGGKFSCTEAASGLANQISRLGIRHILANEIEDKTRFVIYG